MINTVTIISDLHCGASNALTMTPQNSVQTKLLSLYDDTIEALGKRPDLLIVNGDAVDGPQTKGGDLTERALEMQDKDAAELIARWKPKEVMLVSGTHYHVSAHGVCHENNVVNLLNAMKIKASYHRRLRLTLQDWFLLECRHFIPGTSSPMATGTAPSRSKMWRVMNSTVTDDKRPDLMVFSHRHAYHFSEDAFGATVVTPAWQASGGVYGDEICDGHIDLGAIRLDLDKETQTWNLRKKLYSAHINTPVLKR